MDVAGESLLYDESMVHICLAYRQPVMVPCQAADIILRYRGQGELDHEYRKKQHKNV